MNLRLRQLSSIFALGLVTSNASARREGYQSTDCRSCHTGNGEVELAIAFDPEQPNPGDLVTLTVTVTAEAAVAGVAIASNGLGQFRIPDGESLRAEDIWVTHNYPKTATDGVVQFRVEWQAPTEPGIADFNVAVVAANGNGAPTGDGTHQTLVALPFGCDVVEVYADADGDGHGDPERPSEVACSAALGYAASGDDCDDQNRAAYPGAPEQCNELDDDCDGARDEDVTYRPYYFDNDHDGFGNVEIMLEDCAPPEGTVENALDCDDFESDTSPGSLELCDRRDNDCNDVIDDNACPGTQSCVDGACVENAGVGNPGAGDPGAGDGVGVEMPSAPASQGASPSASVPADGDAPAGGLPSSNVPSGAVTNAATSSGAATGAGTADAGATSVPPPNGVDEPQSLPNTTSGCAVASRAGSSRAGSNVTVLWLVLLAVFVRRSGSVHSTTRRKQQRDPGIADRAEVAIRGQQRDRMT